MHKFYMVSVAKLNDSLVWHKTLYDLHLDKKDVVYISVDDYSTLIKYIRKLMLLEVHHMQLSNYFKTSLRAYTDKPLSFCRLVV